MTKEDLSQYEAKSQARESVLNKVIKSALLTAAVGSILSVINAFHRDRTRKKYTTERQQQNNNNNGQQNKK